MYRKQPTERAAWIDKNVPESEWKAVWETISRQWVNKLSQELGGNYRVCETPNFLILTEASERIASDACTTFEAALNNILRILGGIALDDGFGKHVVLMFGNLRTITGTSFKAIFKQSLGDLVGDFPGG